MRRSAIVVLIGCVALLGAAAALAHTKRFSTDATLVANKQGARGEVSSPKPRCVRNRSVAIKLVKPDGTEYTVGRLTNENGRWADTTDNYADGGTVTATVRRKILRRSENHRHVCRPKVVTDTIPGK